MLSNPTVWFDLTKLKNDMSNPETYKQFCLQLITEYPCPRNRSLMVQKQRKESLWWLSPLNKCSHKPFICWLPDVSSIFMAETNSCFFWLVNMFTVLRIFFYLTGSDSLSSLQTMYNLKYDHPVLVQILELYVELTTNGKEVVFVWVPGHVGIGGNLTADSNLDSAVKDALDGDISDELIPFSDLNSSVNKYLLELWQLE